MRVFLCSYNDFTLAIPIKYVLSIFLVTETPENKTAYFTGGSSAEECRMNIRLPYLFNCHDVKIHHGIIIKKEYSEDSVTENILLTAEIKSEHNIPSAHFHPVPKSLSYFKITDYIKGIHFNTHEDCAVPDGVMPELTLLLNPAKLVKAVNKEYNHD